MAYLTTFYWGWLLASVLLGFAMGWISVVQPGRFGYWLDLLLFMFALYLCGCVVGAWLRAWVVSRSAPPA
jgi:hypothetical protein